MGYDKFEGLNQITDAYQKAVAKTILENELGYKEQTTGYELTHSIGKSGWSFGGYQLDISQRSEQGLSLLKNILAHEQIDWTSSLEAALKSTNSSLLSSNDKLKIDNALSSSYGKEILNKDFTTELVKVTNHIDKIEIELQKINPDLKLSAGEKLMLADFHNQFNLGFDTTQSGSMLKKIEDYIRIKGDITSEGLVDLFKTTKQYKNNKISQEPRIQKSYDAAKELDAQTDDNGDYQVWEKDKNGNFVQTNQIDYSQITNTAINQIGSLIIANNQNFSNIEKIAVSSSVATIADFASYAQSGKNFNLETSALNNLQGAVVGFAVSAYFAKNDNISDILNFSLLATKKRPLIIYNIINKTNPVNNPNYLTAKSLLVG